MITWANKDEFSDIGSVDGKPAFKITSYKPGDWSAFFLPFGWTNFGNNCRNGNAYYKTAEDAKADCQEHLAKFGANASEWERLEITATTLRRKN
jgi:hypothetical protein